jgi:hypothetical protein
MNRQEHKMRWTCSRNGCWKDKNQLKFDVFNGCFPKPSINFSDIDGIVEWKGHFLLIEWKYQPIDRLEQGQFLTFQRFSRIMIAGRRIGTVWVIAGDAEQMNPTHIQEWQNGQPGQWQPCDLHGLRDKITAWFEYVDSGQFLPAHAIGR